MWVFFLCLFLCCCFFLFPSNLIFSRKHQLCHEYLGEMKRNESCCKSEPNDLGNQDPTN